MNRPANDPPGAPARATPHCAPRWWRPPGPRPGPAAPTWARNTSASGAAFGSRGETKAIFAVAHTILVIPWHVLAENNPYPDRGVDYFTRRSDPEAHARRLAREI